MFLYRLLLKNVDDGLQEVAAKHLDDLTGNGQKNSI
jgi:hypothetical protein